MPKKRVLVYGPYYTSYSIASVNRFFADALSRLWQDIDVRVGCKDDQIDYKPTALEIQSSNILKDLVVDNLECDILIYNNFPKSFSGTLGLETLPGKIKIMYLAWEDSIYPEEWVKEINKYAHGVMVISEFIKDVLLRSGIKLPIEVVPCGLNPELVKAEPKKVQMETPKRVKFLHISTAKPRKGVDVLLKAYAAEFTEKDDVSLILKTSPGPDNNTESMISKLGENSSMPHIIHINRSDLNESELKSLYQISDYGVYPSRAEGFGLPALESMYMNKPVVVTNYSGFTQFCNSNNSYLLDYELVKATDTATVNPGAMWAEPDFDGLRKVLRELYTKSIEGIVDSKSIQAHSDALELTWDRSAQKAKEFLSKFEGIADLKNLNYALLSPVNDETGIARYAQDMSKQMEALFKSFYYFAPKDISSRTEIDSSNVFRTWTMTDSNFAETLELIEKFQIDILHIQYHSGCSVTLEVLNDFLQQLNSKSIRTIVTMHQVKAGGVDFLQMCPNLSLCQKVILLSKEDCDYASKTLKNTFFQTHFAFPFKQRDVEKLKEKLGLDKFDPIIATHGLLNTNKGVKEIVEGFIEIKKRYSNSFLFLLNAVSSNNIHAQTLKKEIEKIITDNNLDSSVAFITDFLPEENVKILLQICDVIIFAYSEVGESLSGAVRKGLGAEKPCIVTDIKTFREFNTDQVYKIEKADGLLISNAVFEILADKNLSQRLIDHSKELNQKNSLTNMVLQQLQLLSEGHR